ncbi:hypothetical protein B5S28_g1918 [[Candida] boidinii]|nr:hypothetical protein B5S28_g1918 [[Candida] boidinii]OWB62259.1 hypothetical protein B5S29_g3182 [[Candida] boidinii]
MDLIKIAQNYLNNILLKSTTNSSNTNNEIRVLLLDKHTSPIISLITTQSELLKHDIYLIDTLENINTRDKMRHLKCICFLKPTDETITLLTQEISNPKYKSYEIYFNNIISKTRLERLAESDDLEIITKIIEIFEDYYTIIKDLYSFELNYPENSIYNISSMDSWNSNQFNSSVESLISLILSLNSKPIIRYENNSKMCSKLASSLIYEINSNQQLFDFKKNNSIANDYIEPDTPPLLLILDRKNDPITPLLIPWTFQSMVHELIGIKKNTVDMVNLTKVTDELKTVILSPEQDTFFRESMYLNFGDLSEKIKNYVNQYKQKTKLSSNVDTLQDMKKFLENYPEFRKFSLNVAKHMALASELDKQINLNRLWEISELEQSISCSDNHNNDIIELERLLLNEPNDDQRRSGIPLTPITDDNKLRLVSLYALRYENHTNNQLNKFIKILVKQNISYDKLKFIDIILSNSGINKRLGENDSSINDNSIFAKATSNFIAGFKNHNESDNIYMQHIPRIEEIISKCLRGKLNDKLYPSLVPNGINNLSNLNQPNLEKSQDIIIFIVGGCTYEEARIINNLNQTNKNLKIVLGGNCIHNTKSFINELTNVGTHWGGVRKIVPLSTDSTNNTNRSIL